MIKERPILMSAPMVRAIPERKTQTRRTRGFDKFCANVPEGFAIDYFVEELPGEWLAISDKEGGEFPSSFKPWIKCPYGTVGNRLWVRETIWNDSDFSWLYSADDVYLPMEYPEGWTSKVAHKRSIPSIHMPRWASRTLLEITGIRVERLQDISEDDAIAEGILFNGDYDLWWDYQREQWICVDPIESYKSLICKIKGPETWEKNPWVWVVEFRVIEVKGGSHENL